MNRERRDSADELASILKSADPAASEPGLSEEDAARLRRVILAERDSRPARGLRWSLATGASLATLALAALLLIVGPGGPGRPVPPTAPDGPGAAGPPAGYRSGREGRKVRTIHFVTAGGTRVVWSLDPDFDV